MGALLGKEAKFYTATTRATWGAVGSDGYTHEGAAPSGLTEVKDIRDLSFPISTGEADVSTRGSDWEQTLATMKKASIDFEMVYDTSDAGLIKIQSCFFTKANLPVAVLDGDKATVGTRGFWLDAMVTKFEVQQPLEGGQMVQISLKPGYSSVPPEPVKVTS